MTLDVFNVSLVLENTNIFHSDTEHMEAAISRTRRWSSLHTLKEEDIQVEKDTYEAAATGKDITA